MSNIQVPGPQYGINELIDALTMDVISERAKGEKYNPLRPSSAGKCTRELGYEFMEYRGFADYQRELKPPDVHRLLNFGHDIERHLLSEMYAAFRKSEKPIRIKYKQQTVSMGRLPDGTLLEGNLDFVIEAGDWKIIADAKSKKDKFSQFYKSSWEEFVELLVSSGHATQFGDGAVYITNLRGFLDSQVDVFFNNNLYQLNKYACTDFCKERGINLCAILQYNKNDSRLREIRFSPDESIAKETKAKFDMVQSTIDTEKSVENLPRDYVLGSAKCGFCDFRKQCWPDTDALKDHFKTLPPKSWPKDLNRLEAGPRKELEALFNEFDKLADAPGALEKIEEKIVGTMEKNKLYKIRLEDGRVYRTKHLKTGGVGGGPRLTLRRDKA